MILLGSTPQPYRTWRSTTKGGFETVCGKEKPGRVRCLGATVIPTILKRIEEIASIEQRHSQEVSHLKEEVSNLTNQFKGMQSLLKVLLT